MFHVEHSGGFIDIDSIPGLGSETILTICGDLPVGDLKLFHVEHRM